MSPNHGPLTDEDVAELEPSFDSPHMHPCYGCGRPCPGIIFICRECGRVVCNRCLFMGDHDVVGGGCAFPDADPGPPDVDARDRYPAFFAALGKVKGPNASGAFSFACPLHERPTLSGSAWLGKDGRLMFGCWKPSHGKHALLAAMGLSWADVFPDKGKPRRPAVIERTHDYVRADGSLSHQKCIDREREAGKGFWRRWCPKTARWIPGLDWTEKGQSFATERILYRLPELLASAPRLVIVTEGERKADLLAELGFVATTAGGATCWLPRYAEQIAARPVCVFPDHNEAGMVFARAVVGSLLVAGCASVRLYEWPVNTPDGWDIGDDIDACVKAGDGDPELRERIMEYVRQARHWRAE